MTYNQYFRDRIKEKYAEKLKIQERIVRFNKGIVNAEMQLTKIDGQINTYLKILSSRES